VGFGKREGGANEGVLGVYDNVCCRLRCGRCFLGRAGGGPAYHKLL